MYIYDILLNFSKNKIIDFYDWDEKDNLSFYKKLPVIRIDDNSLKDLISSYVKVNLKEINKLFYKDNDTFIFSSTNNTIAIIFSSTGEKKGMSMLLFDKEQEAILLANKLSKYKLEYEVLKKIILKEDYLTKNEKNIKKVIKEEIEYCYKKNNIQKLKYYFYEYYRAYCNDINILYEKLLTSLNSFNNKHFELYEIIKMSYEKKIENNIT